jgi:hypothetical protein
MAMDLDEILNKISDFIPSLQKLTNIWVFHATEDVRQEDLASILPPGEKPSKDETPVHPPVEEATVPKMTGTRASTREINLWRLCTVLFMVSLIIYVLLFSPY